LLHGGCFILEGTHLHHLRQFNQGFVDPNQGSRCIKTIPQKRAATLAKSALHHSCKLLAWISVNEKASNLHQEFLTWWPEHGKEICSLHADARTEDLDEYGEDDDYILEDCNISVGN